MREDSYFKHVKRDRNKGVDRNANRAFDGDTFATYHFNPVDFLKLPSQNHAPGTSTHPLQPSAHWPTEFFINTKRFSNEFCFSSWELSLHQGQANLAMLNSMQSPEPLNFSSNGFLNFINLCKHTY